MRKRNFFFLNAFCIFIFSSGAFGQDDKNDQTTADENFKLNITQKQVTETNYQANTQVAVKSETQPPVNLEIGAKVGAEKITMTLKNIFGDVRFRGSLEKIVNQINLRRPATDK